ncbi:reverse transcriptase domain-containing protein [Tanacetum coccineum]
MKSASRNSKHSKEKLTNASIMVSPDWSQPFELMCDASDFAVGAVLGQQEGKNFHPIHFANKTPNNAQHNYTITEKELLVIVLAFDKFRSYLVLSKTIVFTNHSALKYPFAKQDAKPCRGHYGPSTTTKKVFDAGFYWPKFLKEAHTLVQNYDACLRSGSLLRRHEMPQNNIQVSEIFDV